MYHFNIFHNAIYHFLKSCLDYLFSKDTIKTNKKILFVNNKIIIDYFRKNL